MTPRRFAAPGKLMLAGEYSVLGEAGIALAIAVSPELTAHASAAPVWELRRADGPAWRQGQPVPAALRFAVEALQQALGQVGADLPPHRIETRDAPGQPGAGKAGLGSSASATVLVSAAVLALAGRPLAQHRGQLTRIALRAHQQAQGAGSGYDVATVVHGGLVLWERAARRATPMAWPDGVELLAAYSGRSASTAQHLQRLQAQGAARAELHQLQLRARELVQALATGQPEAVIAATRRAHRALARWDRDHRLGIVTAEIQQLVRLAEQEGAAAKVSGAGGGDSVIALGAPQQVQQVAAAWVAAGFSPLPLRAARDGAREI